MTSPTKRMKITYTSPNRPIHYHYAAAMHQADMLQAFVSGFPRFSPKSAMPELGSRLIRRDQVQCLYLASLRWPVLPATTSDFLAWASKVWLDRSSLDPARRSDLFLFYNGSGLRTCRSLRGSGVIRVVEVVNSHVLNQDSILREEHRAVKLDYDGIYHREIATRLEEYQEADWILCPSEFVRQSFVDRGFNPARLVKNPFGFERPGRPAAEAGQRDDGVFRVLYVGSISVRKGLRYLIEAFRQFQHPRKELLLVGPVARQTGLESLAIPPGVKFAGVLKGDALAAAYGSASVFVLPAIEEGLALVMAEALSFGLPVIATHNTGAADLYEDGVEGFQVPVRQPGVILEKLRWLADHPEELAAMGRAAAARAGQLAGWKVSGERLCNTLARRLEAVRSGQTLEEEAP
jgi:alpha-maltose-1-phosphate synthase